MDVCCYLKADSHIDGNMNGAAGIRRYNRQIHGFTLIELLVVVAIIAVLIAVLLPALSASRKSARQVGCLANLHSWHLAITMYAGDYHDAMPVASENYLIDGMSAYWHMRMWPYVSNGQQYSAPTPESRKKSLLYCPSDTTIAAVIEAGANAGRVQGWCAPSWGANVCAMGVYRSNANVWRYWKLINSGTTLTWYDTPTRIGRPLDIFEGDTILLGDSVLYDYNTTSWSIGWNETLNPPYYLDYRHEGKCNLLFLNGSAQSQTDIPSLYRWARID